MSAVPISASKLMRTLQRTSIPANLVLAQPTFPRHTGRGMLGVSNSPARFFSMPSRADTKPFALVQVAGLTPGSGNTHAEAIGYSVRTSAGIFMGPNAASLARKAQRAHALSPLIPAEAVLRTAAGTGRSGGNPRTSNSLPVLPAAVAALAEQTVSLAALGGASAFVLREGMLLASVGTTPAMQAELVAKSGSASVALRPTDLVVLLANASTWSEDAVVQKATALHSNVSIAEESPEASLRREVVLDHAQRQSSMWFFCAPMAPSETWAPLTEDRPHPSWANTIFNEFGTHKEKL